MDYFVGWLFNNFFDLLFMLADGTVLLISKIFEDSTTMHAFLTDIDFNLVLFSDTPIITTNLADFLVIFFSIFYTIIFIVIVWKIIKKVFVKITGWNKW